MLVLRMVVRQGDNMDWLTVLYVYLGIGLLVGVVMITLAVINQLIYNYYYGMEWSDIPKWVRPKFYSPEGSKFWVLYLYGAACMIPIINLYLLYLSISWEFTYGRFNKK